DRKMNDEPLEREPEPIDRVRARLEALLKANAAPRCGARSKRTGKPCQGAAMPNGRCKLHCVSTCLGSIGRIQTGRRMRISPADCFSPPMPACSILGIAIQIPTTHARFARSGNVSVQPVLRRSHGE